MVFFSIYWTSEIRNFKWLIVIAPNFVVIGQATQAVDEIIASPKSPSV